MPIGTKGEKMKELYVGLSSWIIQDGNYSDFVKDDKAEFALELYSQNIEKTIHIKPIVNILKTLNTK